MTREWFTTYCQNAAANVLDKDGKMRFTYEQLAGSLDAVNNHCPPVNPILSLFANIVELCNKRNGEQKLNDNDEYALLLTLLNIHAAYLMVSGLWKTGPEPTHDEYGFEIF